MPFVGTRLAGGLLPRVPGHESKRGTQITQKGKVGPIATTIQGQGPGFQKHETHHEIHMSKQAQQYAGIEYCDKLASCYGEEMDY